MDTENKLMVTKRERRWGRDKLGRYNLLYIKKINKKVLLYSIGSYIQYPIITP